MENREVKLTTSKVQEIRRIYAAGGITRQQLAERYGIGKTTLRDLLAYRTWKLVEPAGRVA
jgi:DNA-binding transcriptional regulator LsrR (DeoR family)